MKYADLGYQPKEWFDKDTQVEYDADGFEMYVCNVHSEGTQVVVLDEHGEEYQIDTIQHVQDADNIIISTVEEIDFVFKLDEDFPVKVYKREVLATL